FAYPSCARDVDAQDVVIRDAKGDDRLPAIQGVAALRVDAEVAGHDRHLGRQRTEQRGNLPVIAGIVLGREVTSWLVDDLHAHQVRAHQRNDVLDPGDRGDRVSGAVASL